MPTKKTNETKDSKISITIAELLDTRKFKDITIQPFKDEQGKKYESWAKALSDHIASNVDHAIIADVDNWDTETDETVYHNHKITQIYIDDKPIYEKKAYGGGSGGGYQDSPEKRHSIEAQNAFTGVVQLIIADKCPKDLEKLAYDHAKKSLTPFIPTQESAKPPPEATTSTIGSVTLVSKPVVFDGKQLGVDLQRLTKEVPDIWEIEKVKKLLKLSGGKGEKVNELLSSLKPLPFKEFVENVKLAIINLDTKEIEPDDIPF